MWLKPRTRAPLPAPSFGDRKGVDSVRRELLSRLDLHSAYDLDRLDLTVRATLDGAVDSEVSRILQQLGDRRHAADAGLMTDRLLGSDDPGRVVYSFILYERGPQGNLLRVQSDNFDQPLDINEGTRLEFGSTAKLRTLVTYLDVVEEFHRMYAGMPVEALPAVTPPPRDPLTRWALDYLTRAEDRGLEAMLEAAMNRRYSASPAESFFTGGGAHQFRNFVSTDDQRVITVREAFQRSVNLVFIRLMRDLVSHYTSRSEERVSLLEDAGHPERKRYLERFANEEGRTFLQRFYAKHRDTPAAEAMQRLTQSGPLTLTRLGVIFRSVRPDAGLDEFDAFLQAQRAAPPLSGAKIRTLYEKSDPGRWTLQDLGYLSHVHPLELWLLGHLYQHPAATLSDAIDASSQQRQDAYRWLFRTTNARAQQRAIQTLVEAEAFGDIHAAWQRQGDPFQSLVASYATAIGSSGDNPGALSVLMGIILNNGVRYPSIRIEQARFAEATPYETRLARGPSEGQRVLSPEVAAILRHELVGVVEHGTGRRVAGGVALSDGRTLAIGGKTGTGDNRFETMGPQGRTSRVINRTAAFTFTIGDHFFGTIIAFVPGRDAADYAFTSALPVQVFKNLLPVLHPLLDAALVHEPESSDNGTVKLTLPIRDGHNGNPG